MEPLTAAQEVSLLQSRERSDTVDILNYAINLQVLDFVNQRIEGHTEIRFTPLMNAVNSITLDLFRFQIDSVTSAAGQLNYSYDDEQIDIDLANAFNPGDTTAIKVYYQGKPTVSTGGFGGFAFVGSNYAYNLGIGLRSNPYNYGRGWFPCFDNFVERSTFDFNIVSAGGRKAFCIGTFLGQTQINGDTILRSYRMELPLTTYLAGIVVANYVPVTGTHQGLEKELPTLLLASSNDTTLMKDAFVELGETIDALEYWYGPYPFDQVGYALTEIGAMEHATLIAYPERSIEQGNQYDHRRLMAHELAHHWWGNISTLSSPADMWFKEGNAEYGAQLFHEYTRGKDAFLEVVKDNHLLVMRTAHVDDMGFQPLSGIPFEQTYGTHTYQKGASMIHNLRGYLGDSLYRVGQQSVLNAFEFDAVDAAKYRDQLSLATGVDMTSFFDDWIYNPGWAGYEIDSVESTLNNGLYDVEVFFEQKLRQSLRYHTNAPIEVTFVGDDHQQQTVIMMADGQNSSATTTLPFFPRIYYLNAQNSLNLSQWNAQQMIVGTGFVGFPYTNFGMNVSEITPGDSAWVNVEHFWIEADDVQDPNAEIRMSDNHWWRISGIFPAEFSATASLVWDAVTSPQLDEDLVGITEDSIILAWRPDPYSDWIEYPYYTKFNPISFDKTGVFRMSRVLPGDYAFANGEFPIVSTRNELELETIAVYPNPTPDLLYVSGQLKEASSLNFRLLDIKGQTVAEAKQENASLQFQQSFDLHRLVSGVYFLEITNGSGTQVKSERIEVIH